MTDTSLTPDQIERDIERERRELAEKVGAIQEKFSPEVLIRGLADGFRDHGGEFGSAVSRSVKQNPVALTLTGIGLAWMIFGRSYSDSPTETRVVPRTATPSMDEVDDLDYRTVGTSHRDVQRSSYDTRGPRHTSREATPAYPHWSRLDLDDDWDDSDDDFDSDIRGADAPGISERAAQSIRGVADSAGSMARSGADRVGAAGSQAAGAASDMSRRTRQRMARARARLARGTEDLSDAARERVIVARAEAVQMAQKADRAMRDGYTRGRDATQEFIEDQPLVAGALALAVGAALAGALPRTRREDEWMGAKRDDLFDEAERIFHEERKKVERVAGAAMSEASNIMEEKREEMDRSAPGEKSAVEALSDEMKRAGTRVANTTLDTAREQKLGEPGS